MTPEKRLNILLANDGSQYAQAAVEWRQNISPPEKNQIYGFGAFNSGQIPWYGQCFAETCSLCKLLGPACGGV